MNPNGLRFSLARMLVAITLICAILTLGNFSSVVSGTVLSIIVAMACLLFPTSIWRRVAYGSLLGCLIAYLLIFVYVFVNTGRIIPANYSESKEMRALADSFNEYVIPVGASVGARLALVLKWINESDSKVSSE